MKKTCKKILSVVLAVTMLLSIAPLNSFVGLELTSPFTLKSDAANYTSDIYTYSVDGLNATITDCKQVASGSIVIPDTFSDGTNTYTVVSIGANAFRNCSAITSIEIPDSVTSIRSEAFANCSSLTSIEISDRVTCIGDLVFSSCCHLTNFTVSSKNNFYSSDEYGALYNKSKTELIRYPIGNQRTSFTIPDSVTSIIEEAFCECEHLESVTISNNVTVIEDHAFESCTALTSLNILGNVTSIGDSAFYDCDSLESITIPNSVKNIGDSAFSCCSALKSVTILNGVENIGRYTFSGCSALDSITIPDSVASIGYYAFSRCYSLESVTIPNSVKSISNGTFAHCYALTSITIPDGVKSIGIYAFSQCDSLESITIPKSVTSIEAGAFSGCNNLKSFTVSPNNTQYICDNGVLYNRTKIRLIQYPIGSTNTEFTIPDSVITIDLYAFKECSNLTSIKIPDRIAHIGNETFANCTNLTEVSLPSSLTIIADNSFVNSNNIKAVFFKNDKLNYTTKAFDHLEELTVFGEGENGKKLADKKEQWKFVSTNYDEPSKTLNFTGDFDIYSDVEYNFLDEYSDKHKDMEYYHFDRIIFPEIKTIAVKDFIPKQLAPYLDDTAIHLTFNEITLKATGDEFFSEFFEDENFAKIFISKLEEMLKTEKGSEPDTISDPEPNPNPDSEESETSPILGLIVDVFVTALRSFANVIKILKSLIPKR